MEAAPGLGFCFIADAIGPPRLITGVSFHRVKMNQVEQQRGWEKTRAMGHSSFLLRFGVLLFGVCSALLFSLIFPFATRRILHDQTSFMDTLPLALPLFILGGLVFGEYFWRRAEADYRKWQRTQTNDDAPKN